MSAPSFLEEEALGKAYDTRLLRRLLPFVRPYWPQVLLTVALRERVGWDYRPSQAQAQRLRAVGEVALGAGDDHLARGARREAARLDENVDEPRAAA